MKLYAILDKKLPGVTQVFPSPSDGFAVRSMQMAPKENNPMFLFPNDYKLICIADVDDQSAELVPCHYDVVEFSALVVNDE